MLHNITRMSFHYWHDDPLKEQAHIDKVYVADEDKRRRTECGEKSVNASSPISVSTISQPEGNADQQAYVE